MCNDHESDGTSRSVGEINWVTHVTTSWFVRDFLIVRATPPPPFSPTIAVDFVAFCQVGSEEVNLCMFLVETCNVLSGK